MNLQESIRRILRENKVCDYDVLYDIAQKISDTLHCDRVGNCVHFAELFVERINQYDSDLLNCFDVVEGYVITKIGDGIPQQHTWIQLRNGEKIDPTFIQFKKWDDNSMYSKNIASKSSGKEYYEWGKEGTWFSERRKQFPNYIFKDDKNLQESIRRILREEKELPIYFKRRIDMETLEQLYQYVLKVVSKRYTDKKKQLNAMTPYKFNHLVTSNLIEEVSDNFELIWDDDGERFNQLWDFLNDRYSKRNIKHFYDIR